MTSSLADFSNEELDFYTAVGALAMEVSQIKPGTDAVQRYGHASTVHGIKKQYNMQLGLVRERAQEITYNQAHNICMQVMRELSDSSKFKQPIVKNRIEVSLKVAAQWCMSEVGQRSHEKDDDVPGF